MNKKDNDARLWALMLDPLRAAGNDHEAAELLSRQLVALVRRERDPQRATYAPGDPLPDPAPTNLVDLDGEEWEHQDAGNGMYRMSETSRAKYAAETTEWEGARLWPFLLEEVGPLTEHASPVVTDDVVVDEFAAAVAAVTRAIGAMNDGARPGDGGEFVTRLLAAVAANLGSSSAVTASRPGSWEASGVRSLLASTVGEDDEYLMEHRTTPFEVVINPEETLDDLGVYQVYEASADHIGRELFGPRYEAVDKPGPDGTLVKVRRGQLTYDELEQMEVIDGLIWDLYDADLAAYRAAVVDTITAEAERLRSNPQSHLPAHLPVTVRLLDPTNPADSAVEKTDGHLFGIESQLYVHARTATPLPGALLPDWDNYGMHEAILAAGHWPHLRIPELAHYGTPTTGDNPRS